MKEEMAKVQLESNLQIVELQLKAQPSTPPKVKEKRTTMVTIVIETVDSEVTDCMKLFEQLFFSVLDSKYITNLICSEFLV